MKSLTKSLRQYLLLAIFIAAPVAAFAQSGVPAASPAVITQTVQPVEAGNDSAIVVHATTPDSTQSADTTAASNPDSALQATSYGSASGGSYDSGPGDSKLGNAFTRTITSIISIFATR
jgi:hypothetical protein